MGSMSRRKGRDSEREVERILRDAGFSTDRNIGGRNQVSGDIAARVPDDCWTGQVPRVVCSRGGIGCPKPHSTAISLAIEVRRRETLSLSQWSRDHEASTPDHFTPAIVYRRSREPWRISLRLDQFLDLLNGGKHGN